MIKFTFFDVGGVVILDFSGTNHWSSLQKEIGIPPEYRKESDNFWDKTESQICLGLDIEKLKPEIEKKFRRNESLWEIIKKISKKTGLGLLTNMYPSQFNEIKKANLLPEFKWDLIVNSSIVNLQKPDREIYEYAQKASGFKGNEILFIDNLEKNLVVPKALGWKVFLYDCSNVLESNNKLLEYFNELQNK
jgi:HAD superfamily hydrolase (TIGR01509 family)